MMSEENENMSAQSFVFKLPIGDDSSEAIDLKSLSEQMDFINGLHSEFSNKYLNLIKRENYPPELLKAHHNVISALADYQISLIENRNRRHGHIKSESDMQEMMGQFENIMKGNMGFGR